MRAGNCPLEGLRVELCLLILKKGFEDIKERFGRKNRVILGHMRVENCGIDYEYQNGQLNEG